MVDTAASIFRDFVTDGVPLSGANKPQKSKIRQWGSWLEGLLSGGTAVTSALTIAELKAVDTTTFKKATLLLAGRYGDFAWTLGDYSTQIAADTLNGIYIKADAVAATVGAWVRSYQGEVYVTWWGADPLYANDSAPAFKAARDYLQTNSDYRGGVIYVPKGRYKVNSTIAFTAYNNLHNIYVRGDGAINTTVDFSAQTSGTDGFTFDPGTQFGVSDMLITGSKRDGISINPGATVGTGGSSQFNFHDLRIQFCTGSGFRAINAFMGVLTRIWSLGHTVNGFRFSGFHTSLAVTDCWASVNLTGAGWNLNGICYSTFTACGSDGNQYGWAISNVAGVVVTGCGAESNLRDAVLLLSGDTAATGIPVSVQNIQGLLFDGFFTIANGQTPATYGSHISAVTANSRPISFKIRGNKTRVYTAGDPALILNGASGTVTVTYDDIDSDGTIVVAGTVVQKPMANTTDSQSWGGVQTLNVVLKAGTTTVAPAVMTAGANLTTPAAGAREFDGKVFYDTAVASSRQVSIARQIATVQGSPVALTNSITTAQSIFAAANDALTVSAATTYRFRGRFGFNTGATSHTTAFGFGGTATFTSIGYTSTAASTTVGTPAAAQVTPVAVATVTVLTAASTAVRTEIIVEGEMRINAAGTIIPQVTFSAGPTGTCETAIDSYFELEPIGSNTVAAVGNWS